MVENHAWMIGMLPEICVLVTACTILMVDVFCNKFIKGTGYFLSLLGLAVTIVILVKLLSHTGFVLPQILFEDTMVIDRLSVFAKIFLCGALAIALIYSRMYMQVRNTLDGEYFFLCLVSLLGMMILISSKNFLSLYLGLELLALPLYVMIVLEQQTEQYTEAAMKYFIMGALASGLMLYGISLIYGVTGNLDFSTITAEFVEQTVGAYSVLKFGMLFVLAGLIFKLGGVPFHMWVPDVYEGSPSVVTIIIATLPKVAGFGMAYRLLSMAFPEMNADWQSALLIMATLSIIMGNVIAIAQRSFKRMLAYSTIGHIGFMLLGLIVGPKVGYTPALFYVFSYVLMVLLAFGMIILLSTKGYEINQIQDFKGLSQRYPWYAFLMLLLMFSFAGVPPLLGFYAKFVILDALVKLGYLSIAVVALLFSVVGAFYYLRVVRVMYFEHPNQTERSQPHKNMSFVGRFIIGNNGIFLLILGIYPAPLLYICTKAFV